MGNGDELQKNDMEIAADGNKLGVRFVSGMVEPQYKEANIVVTPVGVLFRAYT